MLKIDYTNEYGVTINNVLIYVNNTNIDNTRTTMKGDIHYLIRKEDGTFYPPFNIREFRDIPYDYQSGLSPTKQFYEFLKTQEEFVTAADAII